MLQANLVLRRWKFSSNLYKPVDSHFTKVGLYLIFKPIAESEFCGTRLICFSVDGTIVMPHLLSMRQTLVISFKLIC